MGAGVHSVDRDARALALVKLLIENKDLEGDKGDIAPVTFDNPIVLSRRVALPGVRSSEAILAAPHSRKSVLEAFGCQLEEQRLMSDSDMSRKPDKIQDMECFLGVYEWLEFLPGAEFDELEQLSLREQIDRRLQFGVGTLVGCGRKESALLALFLNFGTMAERFKDRPTETKQWAIQRIDRLVQQGFLLRKGGPQGLIRVHPGLLRSLKRIEPKTFNQHSTENKAFVAK